MQDARVRDIMTRDPHTVPSSTHLLDAYERMVAGSFHHLPVVDEGRAVGLVTAYHLLRCMSEPPFEAAAQGRLGRRPIAEIMTHAPLAVFEDDPLDTAAELMLENDVGSLLVVAPDDRLVGILTTKDLARVLLRALRGEPLAG